MVFTDVMGLASRLQGRTSRLPCAPPTFIYEVGGGFGVGRPRGSLVQVSGLWSRGRLEKVQVSQGQAISGRLVQGAGLWRR